MLQWIMFNSMTTPLGTIEGGGPSGKETIADRLKRARVLRGFDSASQFARRYDIDGQTYRRHENGARQIVAGQAKKYADFLGIDLTWLIAGIGSMECLDSDELSTHSGHLHRVPVLNWIQASKPGLEIADLTDVEDYLPVTTYRDSLFALTVTGSSMDRVAGPGSHIIIDPNDVELIDRKLYVISFEDDTTATFKRYRIQGDRTWLEPVSNDPDHGYQITLDRPFRVVGRVVGTWNKI